MGYTCPNRDGRIGMGGCSYCNNSAFVPSYCEPKDSITAQIQKGISFFGKKYPEMRYLAYFQAYTSTYSEDRNRLLAGYKEALNINGIEGIIISTRPDCIDISLLEDLKEIAEVTGKRVMFEIGVETIHDDTLIKINRGHTGTQALNAIKLVGTYGFDVCVHLIMGLPEETEEMMMQSIDTVCNLPITSIKLHQLQIIKGTEFEKQWKNNPDAFNLFDVERYLNFCRKVIERVPSNIAIERFTSSSPADLLLAPKWGLKNYEFSNLL